MGDKFNPLTSSSHKNLKELFRSYPRWNTDPKQFNALYGDPKLIEIDATWIDQLNNYSHWDTSSHQSVLNDLKRVSDFSGLARVKIFENLPIPNYSEFRQWATVYVLQKSQKGKSAEGLKAFRKMAHLSHSTGSLTGNMLSAEMLKDEYMFSKNLKLYNWKLVPTEKIEAYKRVSWAWLGLVRTTWFDYFPKEFEPYLRPETGVCAAAWEHSNSVAALHDFLENKIVFEKDFSENLEYSRSFQKNLFSICNMKNYEGFLNRTPAGAIPIVGRGNSLFMIEPREGNTISLYLSRVPYIRQIIGLSLIIISIPNYLKYYEQTIE